MAKHFCTNCGAQIKRGATFCVSCGRKLQAGSGNKNGYYQNVPDSPRKRKWWIPVLCVLGAFVLLGAIADIIGNRGDTPAPGNQAKVDLEAIDASASVYKEIENKYLVDGKLPEGSESALLDEQLEYAKSQYEAGEISFYEQGENCVYIEFPDGGAQIIAHLDEDILSGGGGCRIACFQPYYERDVITRSFEKILTLTLKAWEWDAVAEKIARENSMYSLSDADNLICEEVTLSRVLGLKGSKIVIWQGHGGYSPSTHSGLFLPISYSLTAKDPLFAEDCREKRITSTNDDTIFLTADFFDVHFEAGDFADSIIFLGACYSLTDTYLADIFQSKGAQCVFGNTDAVNIPYSYSLSNELFENMLAGQCAVDAHRNALQSVSPIPNELEKIGFSKNENQLVGNRYFSLSDGGYTLYEPGEVFTVHGTCEMEGERVAVHINEPDRFYARSKVAGDDLVDTLHAYWADDIETLSSLAPSYVQLRLSYFEQNDELFLSDLELVSFERIAYSTSGVMYDFYGTVSYNDNNGHFLRQENNITYETEDGSSSDFSIRFPESEDVGHLQGKTVHVNGSLCRKNGALYFDRISLTELYGNEENTEAEHLDNYIGIWQAGPYYGETPEYELIITNVQDEIDFRLAFYRIADYDAQKAYYLPADEDATAYFETTVNQYSDAPISGALTFRNGTIMLEVESSNQTGIAPGTIINFTQRVQTSALLGVPDENMEPDAANTGFYAAYAALLADAAASAGAEAYEDYNNYALYDMDGDGVPEYIMQTGTCEADRVYWIYTVEDGVAQFLGHLSSSHSTLYGARNALVQMSGIWGHEDCCRLTIENGELVTSLLYSAEVDAYWDEICDVQPIAFYGIRDQSGLQWTQNPSYDNWAALEPDRARVFGP